MTSLRLKKNHKIIQVLIMQILIVKTIQILIRLGKKVSNPKKYSCPEAKKEEINILIKRLDPKKTTGPDEIPLKIIKLSTCVIGKHLTNIINTD